MNINELIIIGLLLDIMCGSFVFFLGTYLWRKEYPNIYFREKQHKFNSMIEIGYLAFLLGIVLLFSFIMIVVIFDIFTNFQ